MKLHTLLFITAITFIQSNTFSQWSYQQPPANASHYITIQFSNLQIGSTGGAFLSSNFYGRGAYTTNGGQNWFASFVPDSVRVMIDIKFINPATAFCSGAYNIGVQNYSAAKNLPINFNEYDKRTLQRINSFYTPSVEDYKGLFLKTTNSGQNWFSYGTLPSNVYYMYNIHFINPSTCFATVSYDYSGGVNSGVIKTTNSGLNWSVLTMPENINSLYDIYFTDINTGFAVGRDNVNDTSRGVILRTTNSGLSWQRQIFMQTFEFSGIDFANSSTGFAVTFSLPLISNALSQIFKTTNSGVNWFLIKSFNDVEAQGIKCVAGTGIALTYGAKYLLPDNIDFFAKTTNYGANWRESSLNDTGAVIIDVKMLDINNWYSSGGDFETPYKPIILKTTNGGAIGITQISNEVPESYKLFQNYPNPFNPVTKIKFSIPSVGDAYMRPLQMIVYDVLGREVATLVNEQLQPGTYEVSFNASGLTSGTYFYELRTDGYFEAKKMIIVK